MKPVNTWVLGALFATLIVLPVGGCAADATSNDPEGSSISSAGNGNVVGGGGSDNGGGREGSTTMIDRGTPAQPNGWHQLSSPEPVQSPQPNPWTGGNPAVPHNDAVRTVAATQ